MYNLIMHPVRTFKGIFYESDIVGGGPSGAVGAPPYKLTELGRDHFEKDPVFDTKYRRKKFIARSDGATRCRAFLNDEGRVVSYVWLSISESEMEIPWIFDLKMILRPGCAYIWDCLTAEDYRRQGLYKKGIINALSICAGRGVKKVYICCAEDNRYSRAGIESVGMREIFKFSGITIGPLCFLRKAGGRVDTTIRGRVYDVIR